MSNDNMRPCPDCNATGARGSISCQRCCGRGTVWQSSGHSVDSAIVATDPLNDIREAIALGLVGFVNDPPDSDFQEGYQAALFVVATEILGMDPGPSGPTPDDRARRPQLRVVSRNGGAA